MKRLLFGLLFIGAVCTDIYFFLNKTNGLLITAWGCMAAYLFMLYEYVQHVKRQRKKQQRQQEKELMDIDISELFTTGVMATLN